MTGQNSIPINYGQFRDTVKILFANPQFAIAKTNQFGKVYSKITNLVLDIITAELQFKGSIVTQKAIPLNSQSNFVELIDYEINNYITNYKYGTNVNQIILFSVNE